MAWVKMPLIIKVEMTKENYEKLMEEAKEKVYHTVFGDGTLNNGYYKNAYKFDGKYFFLDSEEEDDFCIYQEAEMIAKYATTTESQVGLIFTDGISYTVGDLYFIEGKLDIRNDAYDNTNDWKAHIVDYLKRKEEFLRTFE